MLCRKNTFLLSCAYMKLPWKSGIYHSTSGPVLLIVLALCVPDELGAHPTQVQVVG